MVFNPLPFEKIFDNDDDFLNSHDCRYMLPTQFSSVLPTSMIDGFSVLNVNIRSLSKKR